MQLFNNLISRDRKSPPGGEESASGRAVFHHHSGNDLIFFLLWVFGSPYRKAEVQQLVQRKILLCVEMVVTGGERPLELLANLSPNPEFLVLVHCSNMATVNPIR